MKKAVLTIVAAGIVAGGVATGILVLKKKSAGGFSAAEVLPAETIALVEFPDLKTTGLRWKETSLWKIAHEPEVQAFLERPRAQLPKNETWEAVKTHLRQASVRDAFVAVTAIENNNPRVVGGVSFDGSRKEIEALVAKAREKARAAAPEGKADLIRYNTFEIESFSREGVTLAGAFAGNWYLAANDLDLLKATLDRVSGGSRENALSGNEVFQKSLARGASNPELRVFVKLEALTERLLALAAFSGKAVDPAQAEEIRKMKALGYTARFEGERIRDTTFILSPGAAKVPSLNGTTLALTSPATFLYYGFAPILPEHWEVPSGVPDRSGVLAMMESLSERLAQQGFDAAEFQKAFGPEFGVLSDWEPAAQTPSFGIVAEVRNEALARKFAETCLGEWARAEGSGSTKGATFWTAPAGGNGMVRFAPTAALTSRYFLLGLDSGSVQAAAARISAGGDTLAKNPVFEGAAATVRKAGTGIGYLDTKTVFERTYGTLRPLAMLYAGFVPQLATYIDVAKLPTTEPISKHLLPTVLTASQTEDGFLTESTGSVTFAQGGALIGAAVASAVVPALDGTLPLPGLGKPKSARARQHGATSPAASAGAAAHE